MRWWMHELPAYSPVTAANVVAAMRTARSRNDSRDAARRLIAAQLNADRVVLTDSGRSALNLALCVLLERWPREPLVAIPAFQCYEVATAAVGAPCRILPYDMNPDTLAPDLGSLEKALERGARVVVIAPLYGLPVDWDAVHQLADRYHADLVEDAAQGHGATWRNRAVGALADVSVLSFGRGKGWTGSGGGAVLLRNMGVQLESRMLMQRGRVVPQSHGLSVVRAMMQVMFGHPAVYGIPAAIPPLRLGETIYHEPTAPSDINAFSAALLVHTAATASQESLARRRNAALWNRHLPTSALRHVPHIAVNGVGGYVRYPLRVPNLSRLRHSAAVRRAGIARSYPLPLDRLPAVAARIAVRNERYPGADALAAELVTLPTHSRLSDAGRRQVLTIIREWFPSSA